MPDFFSFQQGSEDQFGHLAESSPLLGRFRAVPRPYTDPTLSHRRITPASRYGFSRSSDGAFPPSRHNWHGSIHIGDGTLLMAAEELVGHGDAEGTDELDEDLEDLLRAKGRCALLLWRATRMGRMFRDTWVTPKAVAVKRLVASWWKGWLALVVLPGFMATAWCAIPLPQKPLPNDDDDGGGGIANGDNKVPGHGAARVRVNFWFFLLVYYALYNLTALVWVTKIFNLYSLNWWPKALGLPLTVSLIGVVSLVAPVPIYLSPETFFLTSHNAAWIAWTFIIMGMPVVIVLFILMLNKRHLGLRHSLSETQRIFTSSWFTCDSEDNTNTRNERRRPVLGTSSFDDPDASSEHMQISAIEERLFRPPRSALRFSWLPASFVRFVWFCIALAIGLFAYLIGETYAEIYLRTLPHNNWETIVYVYGWVATIYLLDALTGWILGSTDGERVGSYPLSWTFKLYFQLTYQTYVRALYARLRSPSQFILLQALSSTSLIVIAPTLMSRSYHRLSVLLNLNGQSYAAHQKTCVRNLFIRFLAENVSMLTFVASILVLHFGANKDVYPYFAFDDREEEYDFGLTFYASSITWACEVAAAVVVGALLRGFYGVHVLEEGRADLVVWPELLPTTVAVMVHVLQNMLFSIVRLQF